MAFFTIRRKTVIIVLSIVLAAVTIAATAATVVVATRTDNGITVVIDAGHGGMDGGVTGVSTGTKESDVNLSIAKYLQKYFEKAGYNVVMTRTDSGAAMGGVSYSKREDMRARKAVVKAAAPDLVISVHCNSYPVESVKGAQAFFSSARGQGERFATAVQGYFNDVLNDRDRKAMVGDYYILNCTEYPSILCECGFLSNVGDESKLIGASYQEKVAYTIFSAVNSVFDERA
ncbi:MAG: N-acetylmuramoyl-L-alanine amidase [Clostridiales bacterium]|nr:N-acetylmuramoyl-L-alanine amidase [Clostridiales bacterium]